MNMEMHNFIDQYIKIFKFTYQGLLNSSTVNYYNFFILVFKFFLQKPLHKLYK